VDRHPIVRADRRSRTGRWWDRGPAGPFP